MVQTDTLMQSVIDLATHRPYTGLSRDLEQDLMLPSSRNLAQSPPVGFYNTASTSYRASTLETEEDASSQQMYDKYVTRTPIPRKKI